MKLTNELFLQYQRCHRRAYLDVYGDLSLRDPPSGYVLKLRQDNQLHQQQSLEGMVFVEPQVADADLDSPDLGVAIANATIQLMEQGVDRIYRGVLQIASPEGIPLVSRPDLWIRKPGVSRWGNWQYEPLEWKLGKRPKLEYQITATFHAYVLAQVQKQTPETAWLLLRDRAPYAVNLSLMQAQMQTLLQDCLQMLQEQQEPEVFIARSRCSLCQWFSHCYAIASQSQHLSLLPGVTPSRYTYLKELNLTSVEALANVAPKSLELLPGFGPDVSQKLVRQAEALLLNQALPTAFLEIYTPEAVSSMPTDLWKTPLLGADLPESSAPFFRQPQPQRQYASFDHQALLETAAVELYFDIEAEPELNLVYLHGVLVVDQIHQTQTFYPFLAEIESEEGAIWQEFLALVHRYPQAPIFHFCPYEVQTVKRLGQLYHTPSAEIQQLVTRFIDLHAWVTQAVTLPVESYALKPIARWLGFQWSDASANGAQAIYWYAQWLATGNRSFLESILQYNEDDCRATYHVKAWLSQFLQAQRQGVTVSS